MTAIQNQYWANQETIRHNREMEAIQSKQASASEQQAQASQLQAETAALRAKYQNSVDKYKAAYEALEVGHYIEKDAREWVSAVFGGGSGGAVGSMMALFA